MRSRLVGDLSRTGSHRAHARTPPQLHYQRPRGARVVFAFAPCAPFWRLPLRLSRETQRYHVVCVPGNERRAARRPTRSLSSFFSRRAPFPGLNTVASCVRRCAPPCRHQASAAPHNGPRGRKSARARANRIAVACSEHRRMRVADGFAFARTLDRSGRACGISVFAGDLPIESWTEAPSTQGGSCWNCDPLTPHQPSRWVV